ncbi:MAG: hypothetical protein RJA09_1430 [Pseudomonadota bacterium]|jgi:signal transduction histidine kinase
MNGLRTPSIQRRLSKALLWFALITGFTVSVVVWLVVQHEMEELMDQGLRESAEIIYGVIDSTPVPSSAPNYWETPPAHDEKLIWQMVSTTERRVIRRSHKAPDTPLAAAPQRHFFDSADGQWRVVTLPFTHDPTRYLLVAQTHNERLEALSETVVFTLLGTLLVGWVSVLVLSRITHQELQPLRDLTHGVRVYDPLVPGSEPTPPQRSELTPIAEAISDLGQRLATRVNRERAFAAHAAHALRTPLAGIDAQLALALRELPSDQRPRVLRAREASQRLTHVVKALLVMFRSGTEPSWQDCSLATLLDAIPAPGLVVTIEGEDHLRADPDLLSAVLANLLDNSARHSATNVLITSYTADQQHHLTVVDNGKGCPPQEVQRLRLSLAQQRYTSDAGSNGLGLVLADIVLRAHLGGVRLPDTPSGFVVELYWPTHHG